MTANIEIMQDTMDRLTAKIERWNQVRWATIDGGVDELTAEHLAAGSYHDFELPANLAGLAQLRTVWEQPLPVANCETSFCLAGDVCVNNGYTFMTFAGDESASRVVKNELVGATMVSGAYADMTAASTVAEMLLGLSRREGLIMFSMYRTLPELWGLAYAVTDGQLRLPDALPDSTAATYDDDSARRISGTDNPADTRQVIFEALRDVGELEDTHAWVNLANEQLDSES